MAFPLFRRVPVARHSRIGFCSLLGLGGILHPAFAQDPGSGGSGMHVGATSVVADLNLHVQEDGAPFPQCREPGQLVDVRIELSQTAVAVVGGQFRIVYDPSCLDFLAAEPGHACDGESPMASTLFLSVDETAGVLFYAVGVSPGGHGILGPVTMACLSFSTQADCSSCNLCFDDQHPMDTRISDRLGMPVPFVPHCSDPVSTVPDVLRDCPSKVNTQVPCGQQGAVVTWDPPRLEEGCVGELPLNCTSRHSGGLDISDLVQGGGEMPLGVSNFCCVSVAPCGSKEACCWSVTVEAGDNSHCDDGNICTADLCDAQDPNAGPDGCVHVGLYKPDGDIYPAGGDGHVDLDDILCVLDDYVDPGSCPSGDLAPCGGDGDTDIADIVAVLEAYGGPILCPCP